MFDRRMLEQIDACRPGSEDARDTGLAPLAEELARTDAARACYERVQKLDRAIGESIHDVDVPEGLKERLLAHLDAQVVLQDPAIATSPARSSRRRWLRWSIAAATAATIAGLTAGWHLRVRSQQLTAHQIHEDILDYHTQDEPRPVDRLDSLPGGYPFSRHVRRPASTMWRGVAGFLHRNLSGVAYEIMLGGATATLYVIPVEVPSLPTAPPPQIMATGGWATAVWQEGSLLYVLVVRGDEKTYRSFIRLAPTA